MSKRMINETRRLPQGNTRSKVRAGMTNQYRGGVTRKGGVTSYPTNGSRTAGREQLGFVKLENGKEINVHPDSLIKRRGTGNTIKAEPDQPETMADHTHTYKDESESVPFGKEESKQPTESRIRSGIESGTGMQTSQSMLSSMLEGSEDEENRKQENMKKEKMKKKGLSEAEKNALVDIELTETETMTLLFIPGIVCSDQDEESLKATKDYKELLKFKVGADSYNNTGSQTLNLNQKVKDETCEEMVKMRIENEQVNNYEIEEEIRKEVEDKGAEFARIYEKSIDDIMNDRLDEAKGLIDSEELVSHISIYSQMNNTTSQPTGGRSVKGKQKTKSKAGTTSQGKSSKNRVSGKEGEGTTKSIVRESDTKSGLSDKLSSSSATQNYTAIQSKTSGFPDSLMPSKMEFIEDDAMLQSSSMLKAIKIVERLLTQTKYHKEHVLYTDYPQVELPKMDEKKNDQDENSGGITSFGLGAVQNVDSNSNKSDSNSDSDYKDEKDPIRLKPLFTFECDFTKDMNITCMDFNKANPDLLAVAYGEYDMNKIEKKNKGLVAFWTLKNPNFPEKMIKTENSVTALAFSTASPNLIAVGDSAGGILIYDCQNEEEDILPVAQASSGKKASSKKKESSFDKLTVPIAESREIDEKHTDIIWEIKWVQKPSKGEVLVSVSGDGRVIEWSIKKGLEYNDLMQLKRQATSVQKEANVAPAGIDDERKPGMTFINTGGLSLDFPAGQSANYFAATEDGTINRCSVSYSERSLDTYTGHTGPVYKVRCSPFWANDCQIFATCSYDWTVRIWNHKEPIGKQEKLICRHQYLQEQVNDIEWSPDTSSVFALVADDGRVEIWDLAINNLEPKLTYFDKINKKTKSNVPKTCVRWSRQSPVLVTGNVQGVVHVYRTNGLDHVQVSHADQVERLLESIKKEDYTDESKDSKRGGADGK
ncbi:unnamed protein product [Moneuplotes crassus]|uniref:Dynein axonemal intermediate chain 4 n=2 Tax=Euplotes crassus TaxID=5936 RepID=A0AAD2D7V6_EUPCR|nr:unnamed protein product [Moneuplotes crassus]